MTEVELLTMFQEVAIVDGVTVVKFGLARYGSVEKKLKIYSFFS